MPAMKLSRPYLPFFLAFVLLFAQQAGAAHAVWHAFEDLATHQDKQAPHPDACAKCANYAHLGSAMTASPIVFMPPRISGIALQLFTTTFLTTHLLAAVARGPPALLQIYA
ncbi:MAG TPA: hypothetical protein VMV88_05950 [Gallionella sp.]|nr:hypothetical protein [Gallionella sp.]